MADWSLKWMYLRNYSTQKGDVLHFMVMVFDVIDGRDSVKLPYVIYFNKSMMAVFKMTSSMHHFVPAVAFDIHVYSHNLKRVNYIHRINHLNQLRAVITSYIVIQKTLER